MTIIEHDISGNENNDSNDGSENSIGGGNTGKTPESFIENRIENIPYYFIAIYNEPDNKAGGRKEYSREV